MLLPLLIDIHTGVDSFYYKIDKGVSAVQEMKNDTFDDLFKLPPAQQLVVDLVLPPLGIRQTISWGFFSIFDYLLKYTGNSNIYEENLYFNCLLIQFRA